MEESREGKKGGGRKKERGKRENKNWALSGFESTKVELRKKERWGKGWLTLGPLKLRRVADTLRIRDSATRPQVFQNGLGRTMPPNPYTPNYDSYTH